MKWLVLTLAVLSAAAGLIAARYWWKASKVFVIPMWEQGGRMEPVDPQQASTQWIVALSQSFLKGGGLNKIAAGWTAAAVALSAVSAVISAWTSN